MPEYRNKTFIRDAKFKLIIFGIQLYHSLQKLAFISFSPIIINKIKLYQ